MRDFAKTERYLAGSKRPIGPGIAFAELDVADLRTIGGNIVGVHHHAPCRR